MNKSIFIFLLILSFFLSSCFKNDNTKEVFRETGISEEINPIRNANGDFIGIDINMIIPNNYDKDEILINPDVFSGISQYENIISGKEYIINLNIENLSNYDYIYKDNSFKISTDNIDDRNNYLDTGAIGFDSLKIYDLYQPYRTKNEALVNLIGDSNFTLSDVDVDNLLKKKGYLGIDDLDKYYLDFYGGNSLYLLAPKIFSGELSEYLETNKNIISLSYNYLYNSLIKFDFGEEEIFSVGEIMDNNIYYKNIGVINSSNKKEINMKIIVDKKYRLDLYKYYNFYGNYQFKLMRND